MLAHSADPDEMGHYMQHCLVFTVYSSILLGVYVLQKAFL